MFGKIKNFIKEGNKIIIQFEEKKVTVEVITSSIINFFAPGKKRTAIIKSCGRSEG